VFGFGGDVRILDPAEASKNMSVTAESFLYKD